MAGMIEARGLVKVYDTEGLRVEALRGIDLEIERGQMVAFEIDPCGDAALDQAAEQAIRQAGPFPPPPGGVAGRYTIYGTAIFID